MHHQVTGDQSTSFSSIKLVLVNPVQEYVKPYSTLDPQFSTPHRRILIVCPPAPASPAPLLPFKPAYFGKLPAAA